MLGRKKNRHECCYGCCNDGLTKKVSRRIFRKREERTWKREEDPENTRISQEAEERLSSQVPTNFLEYNDDPSTSKEDILSVIMRAIEGE